MIHLVSNLLKFLFVHRKITDRTIQHFDQSDDLPSKRFASENIY